MPKVLLTLAVALLVGAAGAFALGERSLSSREDLRALYFFLTGALALKASVDILRPKS